MRGKNSHLCNLSCKDYWTCQAERGEEVYKGLSMRGKPEEERTGQTEVREVVNEGVGIYNDPYLGLRVLEDWKDSKEGRVSFIAQLFYETLARRNRGPSTFVWSINDNLEKEILKEVSNHKNLQ